MDGHDQRDLTLKMTAGQSGLLKANVTTTDVAASGPALKGDTFAARELSRRHPADDDRHVAGLRRTGRTGRSAPAARTSRSRSRVTIQHDGYDDTVTLAVDATPRR